MESLLCTQARENTVLTVKENPPLKDDKYNYRFPEPSFREHYSWKKEESKILFSTRATLHCQFLNLEKEWETGSLLAMFCHFSFRLAPYNSNPQKKGRGSLLEMGARQGS